MKSRQLVVCSEESKSELFPEGQRMLAMMNDRFHTVKANMFSDTSRAVDWGVAPCSMSDVGSSRASGRPRKFLSSNVSSSESVSYYPAPKNGGKDFANCVGQVKSYTVLLTVRIQKEPGATVGREPPQYLTPGETVVASEWCAKGDAPSEWYLKLYDGRGWIPYRGKSREKDDDAVVKLSGERDKFMISDIEDLKEGGSGHKVTVGLLVKMESRCSRYSQYELHGVRGTVKLNLAHFEREGSCKLIVQGCFYIVEGFGHGDVFHVIRIWNPPVRPVRAETLKTHPYLGEEGLQKEIKNLDSRNVACQLDSQNFFGGKLTVDEKECWIRLEGHCDFENFYYIVLSDVNLDNPETLIKLEKILDKNAKESDLKPQYILMGNFSSASYFDATDKKTVPDWEARLSKLSRLLGQYELSQNKIILVAVRCVKRG